MKKEWWIPVLVALVIAVSLPVIAQTTKGQIEGVVNDEKGEALPGVTVVARGPGLRGAGATRSGKGGRYALRGVPTSLGRSEVRDDISRRHVDPNDAMPLALEAVCGGCANARGGSTDCIGSHG